MNKVRVPLFLNKPMCVLIFETDDIAVALIAYALSFLFGGTWFTVMIATVLFLWYTRAKKKAGRGFIKHLPHILGLKSFKGFPHSYVTEFME